MAIRYWTEKAWGHRHAPIRPSGHSEETSALEDQRPEVPAAGRKRRPLPWQTRFVLLAAIWGSSFMFIKVSDEVMPPIQVALARLLFGTATLLLILIIRRHPMARGLVLWIHLAVVAVLANSLPFTLFAYGEIHTTSILAGIWNATTVLFTLIFSMMVLADERPSRARTTGLLLGFGGVLVVLGVWRGIDSRDIAGNILCLGAAISYGLAFPYTRRFLSDRPESTITLITGQLLCGTLELAVIAPFISPAPHALPLKVAFSILALGVCGTGVAYILNYGLIRDAGSTLASTVTYMMPVFSTVDGLIFLGEPVTWYEPIGAVIVIVGVAIAQGRLQMNEAWRSIRATS